MSTFDGIVKEFPDIRIDYFRASGEQTRPPLAYFLSHVHSDHLQGLESCNGPFIYCSPATREILLRLEKYPHRMNFAKGILETRKQTYRHLKKLLKPIPLETPTIIELSPGHAIRVTLFDANHCVGSVCFLIEGGGKAVIYTGDVRSEPWWVNSLCRHPLLVPYVPSGGHRVPLKRLDCIYLDTTFAHKDDPYKVFPTKAAGLSELLLSVSKYPNGTLFYFDSWTFGYEDVWQTLSNFLGSSQIHVDDYRYGLYRALANGLDPTAPEAAKLMGFQCGNHYQEGCLTSNQASQLHSCEKGTTCEIWSRDFVRITPIITRHGGMEMAELGAGGGHGDLDQVHELETWDASQVGQLIALCASKLQGQPQLLASVMELLTGFINDQTSSISLAGSGLVDDCMRAAEADGFQNVDELPLDRLVPALVKLVAKSKQKTAAKSPFSKPQAAKSGRSDGLPKQITFPYSRHSSYSELCDLIDAFKPKDIHPCTVDKLNWTAANSMSFLFGHIYTAAPTFSHDQMMLRKRGVIVDGTVTSRRASSDEEEIELLAAKYVNRMPGGDWRGDFWPPQNPPDHYSPQRESRRRKRKSCARDASQDRTDGVQDPFATANSTIPEWAQKRASFQAGHGGELHGGSRADGVRRTKRRKSDSGDSEYGRLSPVHTAETSRLFVGNLDYATTEEDLRAFFDGYSVEDVDLPINPRTSHPVGYGYVSLSAPRDAKRATRELDGEMLAERKISVQLTRSPVPRRSPAGSSSQTIKSQEPSDQAHASAGDGNTDRILKVESQPLSAEEARLARRQEAYSAALNNDGIHWSKISLISTSDGHQIKEEEL